MRTNSFSLIFLEWKRKNRNSCVRSSWTALHKRIFTHLFVIINWALTHGEKKIEFCVTLLQTHNDFCSKTHRYLDAPLYKRTIAKLYFFLAQWPLKLYTLNKITRFGRVFFFCKNWTMGNRLRSNRSFSIVNFPNRFWYEMKEKKIDSKCTHMIHHRFSWFYGANVS